MDLLALQGKSSAECCSDEKRMDISWRIQAHESDGASAIVAVSNPETPELINRKKKEVGV